MVIRRGTILTTDLATYRIAVNLNAGAFGYIERAEVVHIAPGHRGHPGPGAEVAVKIPRIPPAASHTEIMRDYLGAMMRSLCIEAYTLNRLQGLPCVPRTFGMGVLKVRHHGVLGSEPIPLQFLAMEMLRGQSLAKYCAERFGSSDRFEGIPNAHEFFGMSRKIADALLSIHRRQVVHGDIWHNNVMWVSGRPFFIDFGQAVRRDLSPGGILQRIGSHAYLPPEGSGSVSGDVYSLAGLLFFLATGQPPPRGIADENELKSAVLAQIAKSNPKLIAQNRGVADVIARGLRANINRRLQTVDALLDDIRIFSPVTARSWQITHKPISQRLKIQEGQRHKAMLQGGVYDVFRSDDEISTFMTRVLSWLQPGESYATISVPKYWKQGNLGHDGRFLSMNIVKAKQGIRIERLFLLRSRDLTDVEVHQILRQQLAASDDVQAHWAKRGRVNRPGSFLVSYVMLTDAENEEELKNSRHAGMLLAGGKGSVIFTGYNDTRITSCRLQPEPSLYHSQMRIFRELKKKALPLETLRSKISGSAPGLVPSAVA
jgi:serine/threonine protein kinase